MKAAFVLVLVLVLVLDSGCQKPAAITPPVRWEYKIVEEENFQHYMERSAYTNQIDLGKIRDAKNRPGNFDLDFYQFGQDGWELVCAIPEIETVPDAEYFDGQDYHETEPYFTDRYKHFVNLRTGKILFIFKRRVP
jgi:hypothetical protein